MAEDLSKALTLKQEGNEHFKKKKFLVATECYTKALEMSPKGHSDRAIILKNRAACYLRLNEYSSALCDCTDSLQISPGDSKALYRRAQAHEGRGSFMEALQDIKQLLVVEPKNKEANEMARKLTVTIRKKQDMFQSTEGIIGEMIRVLQAHDTPIETLTQALKNCAILSRDPAGAEKLYEAGAVSLLLPFLDSSVPEVLQHCLQTFVGLCTGHMARAHGLLQTVTLNKLSLLISHKSTSVACSAVAVVKQLVQAVCSVDSRTPRNADSAMVVAADSGILTPVIQMILLLLLSKNVSQDTRDHLMELFISTIPKVSFIFSIYLVCQWVSHSHGYCYMHHHFTVCLYLYMCCHSVGLNV